MSATGRPSGRSRKNSPVQYLAAEDILVLHDRVIEETGGVHGMRDLGLLIAAAERPRTSFGSKELYPDAFLKAAALFESIARNHAFVDGNKRTAVLATARFLFINGYTLTTTNPELERFVLTAVVKKLSIEKIAVWLKRHSRRLSRS